jgi:S1-C subfamily serine protease
MTMLSELSDLVRHVSAAAGPSVVGIGRHGRGSGFVIRRGLVLTNAHNLRGRTTEVHFADGRAVQGAVAGSDVDGDLVVLEVDTGDVPPLEWAGDDSPSAGDVVVVVAAGRHHTRVTWGQVTAAEREFRGPRGRVIAGAIEHTAPCAAGSSGAPVLDADGRVLAVNTHRVDHGFYLARAADTQLRDVVTAMGEGRRFERLRLGVALAPAHVAARLRRSVGLPERDGLLVRGVVEGSPADTAGIKKGDLLVRAGDRELTTHDDLFDVLGTVAAGTELVVGVVRGVEELDVTVAFPAPAPEA